MASVVGEAAHPRRAMRSRGERSRPSARLDVTSREHRSVQRAAPRSGRTDSPPHPAANQRARVPSERHVTNVQKTIGHLVRSSAAGASLEKLLDDAAQVANACTEGEQRTSNELFPLLHRLRGGAGWPVVPIFGRHVARTWRNEVGKENAIGAKVTGVRPWSCQEDKRVEGVAEGAHHVEEVRCSIAESMRDSDEMMSESRLLDLLEVEDTTGLLKVAGVKEAEEELDGSIPFLYAGSASGSAKTADAQLATVSGHVTREMATGHGLAQGPCAEANSETRVVGHSEDGVYKTCTFGVVEHGVRHPEGRLQDAGLHGVHDREVCASMWDVLHRLFRQVSGDQDFADTSEFLVKLRRDSSVRSTLLLLQFVNTDATVTRTTLGQALEYVEALRPARVSWHSFRSIIEEAPHKPRPRLSEMVWPRRGCPDVGAPGVQSTCATCHDTTLPAMARRSHRFLDSDSD